VDVRPRVTAKPERRKRQLVILPNDRDLDLHGLNVPPQDIKGLLMSMPEVWKLEIPEDERSSSRNSQPSPEKIAESVR